MILNINKKGVADGSTFFLGQNLSKFVPEKNAKKCQKTIQ